MAYTAYIDSEFYTNTYQGTTIDSAIFPRIALRASDELDKLTANIVRANGLTSYSDDAQEAIKLATCAFAESLSQIDIATDSAGLMASSEHVNGYSYSGIDQTAITAALATAKQQAWAYLQRGGFTRAVCLI
ncbi:MAG: hypothetical protein M0R51_12115 [Clostridia bacterium]|jgi:hypothetical protein|nr:hypothetical protein [Clostridia bacterium]